LNSIPSSFKPSQSDAPLKGRDGYKCPICKDRGWLVAADKNGEVIWEPGPGGRQVRLVRCSCQSGQDSGWRQAYLQRIDGLTPTERKLSFADLIRTQNHQAIERIEAVTSERRGLVTLTGKPGTGKSTLLMCAVNAAREIGVPAVYTTMTDLLDYLRAAYNPNHAELAFDGRWQLLTTCEILALDEIDEFSGTAWAMERFLRLIDDRWRAIDNNLTLCATNSRLNALPGKVASRLRDGRAEVIETQGADMRPYQKRIEL